MNRREAEADVIDRIMWGEEFHGVDIEWVMDGEDCGDIIRLLMQRREDEARDLIKPLVLRFMEGKTGQKLIDARLSDEWEQQRDSAMEAKTNLLLEA